MHKLVISKCVVETVNDNTIKRYPAKKFPYVLIMYFLVNKIGLICLCIEGL